jgi:hypothetical protein
LPGRTRKEKHLKKLNLCRHPIPLLEIRDFDNKVCYILNVEL